MTIDLSKAEEIEIWLPIVGYEEIYEISSFGQVRGLDRTVVHRHANGFARQLRIKGRLLRIQYNRTGYAHVLLGTRSRFLVHRLVLMAFRGSPPLGTIGIHITDDKKNNRLSNLRWGSFSDNGRDKKWNNGASNQKLSPPQVAEIRQRLDQNRDNGRRINKSLRVELAAQYGVSYSTITHIANNNIHIDVRLTEGDPVRDLDKGRIMAEDSSSISALTDAIDSAMAENSPGRKILLDLARGVSRSLAHTGWALVKGGRL